MAGPNFHVSHLYLTALPGPEIYQTAILNPLDQHYALDETVH